MTHYSNKPGHVRVDFFKPGGKWKYTFEVNMGPFYNEPLIHDAIGKALDADSHLGRPTRHQVYDHPWWHTWEGPILVLEPYHKHAHPVMLIGHGLADER